MIDRFPSLQFAIHFPTLGSRYQVLARVWPSTLISITNSIPGEGLTCRYTMPVFQAKTFRRATTASSTLGERIGAAYRAHLTKRPFLLFGLPFIMIIVSGSFALTPAAALRYERYDRKVKQLSQEEAINLGLKGPDGDEGIKRNPRRRVIGDEREEYYVSIPAYRSSKICAI